MVMFMGSWVKVMHNKFFDNRVIRVIVMKEITIKFVQDTEEMLIHGD